MSRYRRLRNPGGAYFFTLVTYLRRPLFAEGFTRECLRAAWKDAQEDRPFETIALCLLPDHLHCVWQLPEVDGDYSARWQSIKSSFSRRYHERRSRRNDVSASKTKKREAGLWQRRFWEHQIRDDNDLARHVDYIHYNPVKHGLVGTPTKWPWSTFHRFVREGVYPRDWGRSAPDSIEGLEATGEQAENLESGDALRGRGPCRRGRRVRDVGRKDAWALPQCDRQMGAWENNGRLRQCPWGRERQ